MILEILGTNKSNLISTMHQTTVSKYNYCNDFKRLVIFFTSLPMLSLYAFSVAIIDSYGLWVSHSIGGMIEPSLALSGYIIFQLFLAFLFWISFFAFSSYSRIFTILITLPVLLDLGVEKYCRRFYQLNYRTLIDTAFDTTTEQASMYITAPVIFILAFIITSVCIFYASAALRKASVKRMLAISGLFLFSVLLPIILFKGHLIGMPDAAYVMSTYKKTDGQWHTWLGKEWLEKDGLYKEPVFQKYVNQEKPEDIFFPFYREHMWYNAALDHFFPKEFTDSASAPSKCGLKEDDEVAVVLYIVESFRADHSPFCGYPRNTVPLLSGIPADNIIPLTNMRSFGTHTKQSLYGILSDADERDREAKHTSVQAVLKKHGYHCALVENCCDSAYITNTPLMRSLIKGSCDSHITKQNTNGVFILMQKNFSENKKNMYILFDGTGHFPYSEASGSVWGDDLIDLYDETRLVIDKAAYEFIQSVEGKPAIVLIVGDHGESFGEGGRIIHGGPLTAEEQRHVFAMIWYSDAYARRFPEIVKNLRENADIFNSHDQIFHTMPSMGGIHSDLRNPAMDMTERHSDVQNSGQLE